MKKGKKIIRFDRVCFLIFIISFVFYLVSVMAVKSYNIELSHRIVQTQEEITTLKSEVDSLTMNIKNLTDYNRVLNSIDASSMTNRNSTVITLGD